LLGGLDAAAAAVGRVSQSGAGSGPTSTAGTAAVGGLDDLLGPSAAAAPAAANILDMLGGSQPAAGGAVGGMLRQGMGRVRGRGCTLGVSSKHSASYNIIIQQPQ
jgi:hypothetical protein